MEKVITLDYKSCMGCRTCELVCSLHHYGECNPKLSCIRVVCKEEVKEFFPVSCANCSTPLCVGVCPVEAIKIDHKTGTAVVDSNRCIGCKTCVVHCPFGAAGFNPDSGVSFKCDLCEGEPYCARFCPSGAIQFLPLDEVLDKRRRGMMAQVLKVAGEASILLDPDSEVLDNGD